MELPAYITRTPEDGCPYEAFLRRVGRGLVPRRKKMAG